MRRKGEIQGINEFKKYVSYAGAADVTRFAKSSVFRERHYAGNKIYDQ